MRKLVALIVLAGMSNGAAAYWMKIRDAGALLEYNFYAEPATIVKVRDIARDRKSVV